VSWAAPRWSKISGWSNLIRELLQLAADSRLTLIEGEAIRR
jgi:hypothetical protein